MHSVVLTFGTFDLFHIGHLNILERAKNLLPNTKLYVGVSSDEYCYKRKGKYPNISLKERLCIVEAIRYVDGTFVEDGYNQKPIFVKKYNAELVVLGDDWADKLDDLIGLCTVKFLPRTEGVSSSILMSKIQGQRPNTELSYIFDQSRPVISTKFYRLMYDLDCVFNELNINYSVIAGTLLGTVRHKGMIPWDDDLDLVLFRDAIPKMSNIFIELSRLGYAINLEDGKNRFFVKGSGVYADIAIYELNFSSKYLLLENMLPFKRMKFGPVEVSVPNNYENVLTHTYGMNWSKKISVFTTDFSGERVKGHERDIGLDDTLPLGPLALGNAVINENVNIDKCINLANIITANINKLIFFDFEQGRIELVEGYYEYESDISARWLPAPIAIVPIFIKKIKSIRSRTDFNLIRLDRAQIKLYPLQIYANFFNYKNYFEPPEKIDFVRFLKNVKLCDGKMFLQILNPFDFRKDLALTIKAFSIHSEIFPNDFLILKLTCRPKNERIYRDVFPVVLSDITSLHSRNIYFTTDYIESDFMMNFYSVFDFYFSTTRAEGQNLPLQEAMSCGVIPVTPCHTAMIDYCNVDNSIIIESSKKIIYPSKHPDSTFWGRTWYQSILKSVLTSLKVASNMALSDADDFRESSAKTIGKLYSRGNIFNLIASELNIK